METFMDHESFLLVRKPARLVLPNDIIHECTQIPTLNRIHMYKHVYMRTPSSRTRTSTLSIAGMSCMVCVVVDMHMCRHVFIHTHSHMPTLTEQDTHMQTGMRILSQVFTHIEQDAHIYTCLICTRSHVFTLTEQDAHIQTCFTRTRSHI